MFCVTLFSEEHPDAKLPEDIPWVDASDPFNSLVPYNQAEWKAASWPSLQEGNIVRLSSIHFTGIEGGREASQHTITVEDPLLTKLLTFSTFNKQSFSARYNVKPTEDELARRCVKLLGPESGTITMLLGGGFESEEELDTTLSTFWQAHQTKFSEEVVGPLLDEVRQRGLAARHARDLSTQHDLNLPNEDTLRDVEQLLEM